MSKQLNQYLRRHAEPEAAATLPPRSFRQVAVVPAMGEDALLRTALDSILASGGSDVGVILVLNARASDAPSVHQANQAARVWLDAFDPRQVIVIDRATPGAWLPEKQGVGLARKIGNDVAMAWWSAGQVEHPMLLQTDADARVPVDWFLRATMARRRAERCVALTYPFRHDVVPPVPRETIALYEIWLRWHRLALRWAGSPYAFQAIGSTLAVDVEALVLVRGVPRTMAGEDFYLLDKLAKTGTIHTVPGAPIHLAARESDRVPFGTGRAMVDMLRRAESAAEYRLPDPRAYRALRAWLETMEQAVAPPPSWPGPAADLAQRLEAAGLPTPGVLEVLNQMSAIEFVAEATRLNISAAVRRRRLHTWFDAFRSLRFLHALRDALWPDGAWRTAITDSPWLANSRMLPSTIVRNALDVGPPSDVHSILSLLQLLDEQATTPAGIDVSSQA